MNPQSISIRLALIAVTILFVLHGPMEVEAITTSSFVTRTETVTVTSTEKVKSFEFNLKTEYYF
jgi:hypothetical protein